MLTVSYSWLVRKSSLILICFLLFGCQQYDTVRLISVDKGKILSLTGSSLNLGLNIKIDNPTKSNIHIREFVINIIDNSKTIATLKLSENLIIRKRSKQIYPVLCAIEIGNPLIFLKLAAKPQLLEKLRYSGYIKTRVGLFFKTIKISEYDLKQMGFDDLIRLLPLQ